MDAPTLRPTDEQIAILDAVRDTDDNIMVSALAGTGKTSTLELIQGVTRSKPILYLAFSRRVVDEAKEEDDEGNTIFLSTTEINTFNGLGHRIWGKTSAKGLRLSKRKTQDLLRELIKESPRRSQEAMWDSFWDIVAGVAMAKALGYVPEGRYPQAKRLIARPLFHSRLDERPDDLTAALIDEVLSRSIKAAYDGLIDFNDQVYMPACFGGAFPQFPEVWVDEYQDLNPVNHAMLDRLAKGRLIGVGDDNQSIYAFRGARQGGMAFAKDRFSMHEMPLSVSFRCPQAVVEAARWRVPTFKWSKPGGIVGHICNPTIESIADDAAIICRNNAPLFRLALRFLSSGRSVSVAGSDIGPKLVGLLRKLGDEDMARPSVLAAIADWLAQRKAKGSTTADDLADCMRIFAETGSTLSQAIAYAEHLFKQSGTVRFLTGHKAKGLEFPTVYHLDPFLCRNDEQDLNLRYVITTRSAHTLYEINSTDFR